MVADGGRWWQMGADGTKWHQMVADGGRWHQMGQTGADLSQDGGLFCCLRGARVAKRGPLGEREVAFLALVVAVGVFCRDAIFACVPHCVQMFGTECLVWRRTAAFAWMRFLRGPCA